MKTSNKILAALFAAALVPMALTCGVVFCRTAAFRAQIDRFENGQPRVVDARDTRLTYELRKVSAVALDVAGIPSAEEFFVRSDTLVVRGGKVRRLVLPEAEVLLLADTTLVRPARAADGDGAVYVLRAAE